MFAEIHNLSLRILLWSEEPCVKPPVERQVSPKNYTGCCSHENCSIISLSILDSDAIHAKGLDEEIQGTSSDEKIFILQRRGKSTNHQSNITANNVRDSCGMLQSVPAVTRFDQAITDLHLASNEVNAVRGSSTQSLAL
jgi:hypothetical protein